MFTLRSETEFFNSYIMRISKRIISTILSTIILVSSTSAFSVPASAENKKCQTETTVYDLTEESTAPTEKPTGVVSLSKDTLTMGVGETYKLNAIISDTNYSDQKIQWATSNSTVLKVSNGQLTAVKAGTVTVAAKLENGSLAKCSVTVKNAPTSVSLNKTNLTMGVGETFDLNSKLPSGCAAYSIKYSSDDTGVASVKSAGGLVTAKLVGKAVVTATTYNGKTVSCEITVKNAPQSLSLNKTTLTLGVGENYDLNSKLPSGCAAYSIKYSSSNPAVASVKSSGGIVTAQGVGTVNVTATAYNGVKVTCKITVKEAPTSVTLNKSTLTVTPGNTYDLNSSLSKSSASHSVKYTSSNPKVASVKSSGGLVTAESTGTATITATTFNGKKATCTVTVTNGYTEDDLYCLAAVIWQEAGATYCSDRLQLLVANVVMNHVKSPDFPNTIREVITRKGAYGTMYWDGVSIPQANDPITKAAIDRCYANAKKILEGYRILPDNVIYQAGFVQGSGVYTYEEGMYFCYQ